MYKFDAKLRQIVLTIALAIEEDLASILAHIVSDTYCNPAKPETFRSKDNGYEESYSNDCVYEFMTDLKHAFGHYVMNNIEWVPLVLKEMHFKIEYLNKLERIELA